MMKEVNVFSGEIELLNNDPAIAFIEKLEAMDPETVQLEYALYRKGMKRTVFYKRLGVKMPSDKQTRGIRLGPKGRKAFLAEASAFDLRIGEVSMFITAVLPREYFYEESLKDRKKRQKTAEAQGREFWAAYQLFLYDMEGNRRSRIHFPLSYSALHCHRAVLSNVLEKTLWVRYRPHGKKDNNRGPSMLVYPKNAYLPPEKRIPGRKDKKPDHVFNGELYWENYEVHPSKAILYRVLHWDINLDGEFVISDQADWQDWEENYRPLAEFVAILPKTGEVIRINAKGFICPDKQLVTATKLQARSMMNLRVAP